MTEKYNAKLLFNLIVSKIELIYSKNEASQITKIYFEDALSIKQAQYLENDIWIELDKIKLENDIKLLENHCPIQYVCQKAYFLNNFFKVNNHTLIPRPETEELVILIDKYFKNNINLSVLDIGTGSGCIPISLKKMNPNWDISGLDISKEALKIANENANILDVNVTFFEYNILKNYTLNITKKFDIIVSNPPYVLNSEILKMNKNVLDYEPHNALFVSDENSLLFYENILKFNKKYLNPNGYVFFEINPLKSNKIKEMLELFHYSDVEMVKDFNNKIRFAKAKKQ